MNKFYFFPIFMHFILTYRDEQIDCFKTENVTITSVVDNRYFAGLLLVVDPGTECTFFIEYGRAKFEMEEGL